MTIKNVILVGANGKLGPSILQALLDTGTFKVSVLSRSSSKSTFPSSVHQVRVSDTLPSHELVDVLRGQDALVIAFSGSQTAESIQLIDAALEAGVKRVIPADFGSCDSSDPRSLELVPLYKEKKKVRDYLIELETKSKGRLSWTSIVAGHFFDWGLKASLLQVDLKSRKATVFDDGNINWSATTLSTIGLATARILEREEETKNRMLYIQSVCVTQNQLLKALETATGSTFDVNRISSNDFIKEHSAGLQSKDKQVWLDAQEELVSVEGTVNANWEAKKDFANDLLGLPQENLDDLVKKVLAE